MRCLAPLLLACLLTSLGCDQLRILYTHSDNVASWEWALEWYVEDQGGLLGPFTSGGTGLVQPGPLAGERVHVTRKLLPEFVFTWMDVPRQSLGFYTGDMDGFAANGNVTVVLENAPIGQELLLFYPFVHWWTIDQSPWSLTQSFAGEDVIGNDGLASVFVSVRSGPSEEPASRYEFRLGVDPGDLGDVRFDATELRTRSPIRSWQSSADLSGDEPYLVARRQGVFLVVGDGVVDFAGMSGSFGVPSDFPAERWYLFSGSIATPTIVRAFDPASATPVSLQPLAGYLDPDTIAYDPGTRTVSVSAPGLEPVQYGRVLLAHGGGYWELCFPGSALEHVGDTLSLALPGYPGGALPAPSAVSIDLYRLDDGATADDMLRFKRHRRHHPLPSFAMQSAFQFL